MLKVIKPTISKNQAKPPVAANIIQPKDKYKKVQSLGPHYLDEATGKAVELKKDMCHNKTLKIDVSVPHGFNLRKGGSIDRILRFLNGNKKQNIYGLHKLLFCLSRARSLHNKK